MAIYSLQLTKQYLRDLKLALKRGLEEKLLNEIINNLINNIPLLPNHHNHPLKGDYKGCLECHITPDWLLIYTKDKDIKIITLSGRELIQICLKSKKISFL